MRIPKLCRHRSSGRGYVTDPRTGKEVYFAQHGTPEAHAAYLEWIREYTKQAEIKPIDAKQPQTLGGLMAEYITWARGRYRRVNGSVSSHYQRILTVCRKCVALGMDSTPIRELTRAHVLELRATVKQYNRRYQNEVVSVFLTILRWGEEREIVDPDQMTRLERVQPVSVRDGRGHDVVEPASIRDLWAHYRGMERCRELLALHLLLGCRTENACSLRLDYIDTTRTPWLYRPAQHKGSWRGQELVIRIGPRARKIIEQLRPTAKNGYLFPGPRGHRTAISYGRILRSAGLKLGLQPIMPRQIRHTSASYLLRRGVPIHIISAILGHSPKSAGITGRYAVADERDVSAVVERWG